MRVRQGWSGEIEPNVWAKISVELEEEDLRRILSRAGLDPNRVLPFMRIEQVFQLLEVEAEYLVTVKLIARYGYTKGKDQLPGLDAAKRKVLDQLRATYGVQTIRAPG